jgi:hypothetical protein
MITMGIGALVGSLLTLKVGAELPLLVAACAVAGVVGVAATYRRRESHAPHR